jgi:predicted TIM-barrel fold metal-dependent hydrolase
LINSIQLKVSRMSESTARSAKCLSLGHSLSFLGAILALVSLGITIAHAQSGMGKSSVMEPVPALTPYVEVHTHFNEHDIDGTIQSALEGLKTQNAAAVFLQMLPDTFDHPGHYDAEVILEAAKKYPGKLAILGGGGTLNAIIHRSVTTGDAGAAVKKEFTDRAEELIKEGVVGFGEMTAEHFDGATPYQYAPADHPLFLLLADIAAKNGMPIDLHMEAVPQAMPLPADLKSPPNAPQLHENISAFERLLAHNPKANIIWAHAGSDSSGYRTPDLCRRLLQAHPNLYMEIKTDSQNMGKNYPLAKDGKIKPEWFKLFTDFPDRFVIGTDQHYPATKSPEQRWQTAVLLFNQLPVEARRKIGTGNVTHIFTKFSALSTKSAKN